MADQPPPMGPEPQQLPPVDPRSLGWVVQFRNESLLTRAIVVVLAAGVLLAGTYVFMSWLFAKEPVNPVYAKIEHIKRVRQLRLVRHRYEGIIPVTKPKDNRLEMLLVAPAQIEGYIDLSQMHIEPGADSLLYVYLPASQVSAVQIDLDQCKEYLSPDKVNFMGRRLERSSYFEAYDRIRLALLKTEEQVRLRALANGIEQDTRDKAEDYIRNLVQGMGYRVEFYSLDDPRPAQSGEDLRSSLMQYLESSAGQPVTRRELVRRLMGI
ncbi:MAG: hypothetical protein OHK0039_04410 [Bacteroidia bacterium]